MKKFLVILMALAMVSAGAVAQVTDVTVDNHSFEAQVPGAGDTYGNNGGGYFIQGVPTGWDGGPTTPSYSNYFGVLNLGDDGYSSYGPTGEGDNVMSYKFSDWFASYPSYGGDVYQTTGHTILATQAYTATVAIGAYNSNTEPIGDLGRVKLYYVASGDDDSVESNRIEITSGTAEAIANAPENLAVTFNSDENPDAIGGTLGLAFIGDIIFVPNANNATSYVWFDNVRISYEEVIPETADPYITGSSSYAVEDEEFTLIAPGEPGGSSKVGPWQWYRDSIAIGGANNGTLVFAALAISDSGTYTVDYSDGLAKATVTSDPYVLTVLSNTTNVPVTGLLGLGLLAGACALSGTSVLRRKK